MKNKYIIQGSGKASNLQQYSNNLTGECAEKNISRKIGRASAGVSEIHETRGETEGEVFVYLRKALHDSEFSWKYFLKKEVGGVGTQRSLPRKQQKRECAERIWLNYYNRVLFEAGLIAESERNQMRNRIGTYLPPDAGRPGFRASPP